MIILGIETSCDETALSLIDAESQMHADNQHTSAPVSARIRVLADKTLSQIELHQQYGGVFPNLAKREHSRNLIPLLKTVLTESGFGNSKSQAPNTKQIPNPKSELNAKRSTLNALLEREPELLEQFLEFIPAIEKPPIDAIAVTVGPGLEPCLWTGVNFAKALSLVWKIPVVPVNHMEGHIISALMRREENPKSEIRNPKQIPNPKSQTLSAERYTLNAPLFPALALLISGGHTELVLIRDWFDYEIIGRTRDDAVGEAFDKVARLLGLPYPGGPEISRLAEQARNHIEKSPLIRGVPQSSVAEGVSSLIREVPESARAEGVNIPPAQGGSAPFSKGESEAVIALPRPMLHSDDFDFSFSGLKTAVLYLIKKLPTPLNEEIKAAIAKEFEDAVAEVLVAKTKKAVEQYGAKALLIGGGVIANTHIRRAFEDLANTYGRKYLLNRAFLHIPEQELATDNALMIAVTGFLRVTLKNGSTKPQKGELVAKGNLTLDPVVKNGVA